MKTGLSFLFISTFCLATQPHKPDLSGSWYVDKAHSTIKTTQVKNPDPDAPPAPPPPPADRVFDMMPPETISHADSEMTISDGNAPHLKVSTDYKENVNQLPNGAINRSKTRWEGNQLVTEWSMERNGMPLLHGSDRRSLTPDEKMLIDDRTVITAFAETHFHIVWKKKQ